MMRTTGPTVLVLTRQNLPVFDRTKVAKAEGLLRGAYILSKEKKNDPDLVLAASGSEVQLILGAQEQLASEGVDARVVSMPSWELFRQQPKSYRDEVFPPKTKARLAVEAAAPMGWHEWVGEAGDVIGITQFGASAPEKELFKHYGFTVGNVVTRAKKLL
jgi:transketolase